MEHHAGTAGNECAEDMRMLFTIPGKPKEQHVTGLANTGIPCADLSGYPFSQISWLTKEKKGKHATGTSTAPAPAL
eukprot:1148161-Pelagomonas_calceolata.AAC.2